MTTGSQSFRYFILGLLAQQPMSGYDIGCFQKSLDWLLGSPSFGAIYPALHALLGDGLVSVEVVSRPDKPLRKIYTITKSGHQALEEWVAQPTASNMTLKAFIMQLILVGDFAQVGLAAHLQQRREMVAANHSALEQTAVELGAQASEGQRLAMEYGLAMASAELAWLDSRMDQLVVDPE